MCQGKCIKKKIDVVCLLTGDYLHRWRLYVGEKLNSCVGRLANDLFTCQSPMETVQGENQVSPARSFHSPLPLTEPPAVYGEKFEDENFQLK